MKALVIAIGSDGDINPMVEIALALQARGALVEFLANDHFRNRAERAGLAFYPIGDAELYTEALSTPGVWDAHKGFDAVWSVLRRSLPVTYQVIRERLAAAPGEPTVMVGTTLALAARVVQELTGTPLSTVHLAPSCLISRHSPPVGPEGGLPDGTPLPVKALFVELLDNLLLDRACKKDINTFRATFGLAPVKKIFSKWLHSPDQVIAAFPDWFGSPQPDWPPNTVSTGFPLYLNRDKRPLSKETLRFIQDGAPPLVFTAGSAMAQPEKHFERVLAATIKTGRRAVFVNNYLPQRTLPANLHMTRYEPFDELFKYAAVVQHHGGIGTSAQCLAAGAPQLIIPFAHDQFDNAKRLVKLGVGVTIPAKAPVERWVQAIDRLTGGSLAGGVGAAKNLMSGQERSADAIAAQILSLKQ